MLTHPVGLHARPSLKLTKLAKRFSADIGVATSPDGPWINAKSVNRVMASKVPCGARLFFSAQGSDAGEAVQALRSLVEQDFADDQTSPS